MRSAFRDAGRRSGCGFPHVLEDDDGPEMQQQLHALKGEWRMKEADAHLLIVDDEQRIGLCCKSFPDAAWAFFWWTHGPRDAAHARRILAGLNFRSDRVGCG